MSFGPAQDELTRRIIDGRLADVHTSAPGTVVKFNATDYTVDVKLGVQRPVARYDGGVTYEDPPVLPNVPIASFGTTRTYSRPDLAPGDIVWVLFAESSPAEFLDSGTASQPGDTARHSLSGGLAIPITLPGKLATSPKVVLSGAGGDFVALAGKVNARLDALEQWANTHMHATAALGPPVIAAPALVPGGGSVAAAETKAL
jgi:hypothetical protein